MRLTTAISWATSAATAFASVVLLALLYWLFFDTPVPIQFTNLPFPVDKSEYRPGEKVVRTADACRFTLAPARISQGLRGTQNYDYPEFTVTTQHLDCGTSRIPVALPGDLPPGTYYLVAVVQYEVNPLAVRTVRWQTVPFTVVANQ